MKRRFTILTAALALLTFLAVPMGMWGQSTVTFDASTDITANAQSYQTTELTINAADRSTWKATGYGATANTNIIIGKGGANYLRTPVVDGTISSVAVTWSGNTSYYLALQTTTGTELEAKQNPSTSTTKTFNVSGEYSQLQLVGRRSSGTSNAAATITKVVVTYTSGGGGSQAVTTTTTIDASGITNTDANISTAAGSLSATVSANNTPIEDATVTWSGNNDAVATIDSDGVVTLVGAGTVTFTAAYSGVSGTYQPSSDTYQMTVTYQPTTIEITPNYTFWGKNAAFSGSDYSYLEGAKDNVSLEWSRGNGSMYANTTAMRFYKDNTLTFSAPTGYEIVSIELTVSGTYSDLTFSPTGYDNENTTWAGVAETVTMSRPSNASSYATISKFTITLAKAAPKYTLTVAMTNVEEYFVLVGGNEIEFDNNNQAQVSAGATVYVSLTMEDCYVLSSLTVNGSTTGVTEIEAGIYYSFVMPEGNATIGVSATQAEQYTLTVEGLNNVTYTDMLKGFYSEEVTLTNNQATLCEGINVDIVGLTANAGLLLQSVTLNDGTTTTTLELEYGVYHFTMPSSSATLTFTTTTAPTYTLANSIESGRHYIITNGSTKAMGAQNSNNRAAVDVDIQNGTATVTSNEVYEFVINGPDANGYYTIYDALKPGYLYAVGGTNDNHLKTETFCHDHGRWTISFNAETHAASVVANISGRNTMRYNSSSSVFSCYASGQSDIYLYVKNETTPQYDFYKDIAKYTTPQENQPANGWNLIASPVASVTPSVENGLLSGTYDLYYFDQTGGNNGKEWKNYRTYTFPFVSGQGYLYANSNDVTLKFTGTPNTSGEVPLTYSTTANENMRGWNLVGNPFGRVAYISRNFYRMNDAGTEIVASTTTSVNPMEGIFVKAADANDNSITFSTTAPEGAASNENQNVVLDVIRNRGTVIDRAIVSFNDGAQLPKLTINENSTKLYIPQDNEDYAIVRSEAQGELPVSFRASENGTYTLSMNVENVDMNYLHLIDNMTGMDIDLLQTPSYTFEANTNDYANRFKLVFAANGTDEADESSFAFFSNGNLIVNNEGNATLQVIDINGRILSSETISGSCSKAINATTGVYMLRLINGDNVKVQKVVVR